MVKWKDMVFKAALHIKLVARIYNQSPYICYI